MRARPTLRRCLVLMAAAVGMAVPVLAQPPAADREPVDPAHMTAEERRHVPVLGLPTQVRAGRPFDVMVQVGVEPHSMGAEHHIEHLEVLLDDSRVFDATLSPSVGYPVVRVPLVLSESATLTVRARCNLHGTWRTSRALEVR